MVISFLAKWALFDGDRVFYPTLLVVIASYYVLFAVMVRSVSALVVELLVVAALGGHGFLDLVHSHLVNNPGMPSWWPPFCRAYDITTAVFLGGLLRCSALAAKRTNPPVVDSPRT